MSEELVILQAALVYVYAPIIFMSIPLVLALGIIAAAMQILEAIKDDRVKILKKGE